MYRRTTETGEPAPTEHAHETFARLARHMPKGSLIVGDSYFGGLNTLEEIVKQQQHALLSCTQRRPSALFADNLVKQLHKDGDSASLFGEIPSTDDVSDTRVPFMANAFRSEGRNLFTLSTVYSDTPVPVNVTALVLDETSTDTDQHIIREASEMRPEVRQMYSSNMDFVDNADSAILQSLTRHRKAHWSANVAMWTITMLLVVNAKKLYLSAKGGSSESLPLPDWRRVLWRTLAKSDPTAPHPPSVPVRGNEKRSCKSCHSCKGRSIVTVWRCPQCGPICKNCQADGTHLKHVQLAPPTRTRYSGDSFSSSSTTTSHPLAPPLNVRPSVTSAPRPRRDTASSKQRSTHD